MYINPQLSHRIFHKCVTKLFWSHVIHTVCLTFSSSQVCTGKENRSIPFAFLLRLGLRSHYKNNRGEEGEGEGWLPANCPHCRYPISPCFSAAWLGWLGWGDGRANGTKETFQQKDGVTRLKLHHETDHGGRLISQLWDGSFRGIISAASWLFVRIISCLSC